MLAEPDQRRILERDAQLAMIGSALAAARRGQGQALAVIGAAGLGKTTLLRAARESAEGFRVLSARPGEMEQHVPFGAVHQLLDPVVLPADDAARRDLLGGAAALAAPLFEPERLAERFARAYDDAPDGMTGGADGVELYPYLHGLHWLLANLCRTNPVLVVLDDAQWADRASLAWIELLARRCEGLPVAVLIGTRPPDDRANSELLQLLADPAVRRVALQPLSMSSVTGMITHDLATEPHADFVEACLTETGGNPFLLTELLREVHVQQLSPTAATARSVGTLAPDGVSTAIAVRMGRMGADAGVVAEAVAVLGDGVGLRLVADQAELDAVPVRSAARALAQAGLMVVDSGSVSFVHPLMRNTVLTRMDPVTREDAHRRAAGLLEAAGHDDAAVAAHLHQVSPSGDERVVEVLRRAARAARAVGEPQTAALHLRRALDEPPAESLADVLVELGQAETAGGMPEAERHLRLAVALPEGRRRGIAVLSLARALKFRGAAVEAVDLLRSELATLPPDLQGPAHAEITAARTSSAAARRLLGTDPVLLDQPWAVSSELRLLLSGFRAFDLAASGGSREEALALAAQALGVRPLPLDPLTSDGLATLSAGVACNWLGDLSVAETTFMAMLKAARDAGSPVAASTATSMLALVAWRRGDVADCADYAQEALELGDEVATSLPLLAAALGARAQAASEQLLDQDELKGWDRRLATAELEADATPRSEVVHARGALHAGWGDWEGAVALFLEAGATFVSWGATSPAVKPWRSDAALALARLGRDEEARDLVAEEVRLAEVSGSNSALATALTARAVVDPSAAEEDLEHAATLWTVAGAGGLDLARNRLELGRLLRRQRRTTAARQVLQAAQEQAVRCGAERTAAAAREELVAAGARPRRVAVTGREALTVAERRVVELAAQGRTNREIAQELFVSEKTVETHLGHAYAKLGIRSRTALAGVLGDVG